MANNLKPYNLPSNNYFKYILEELPNNQDDTNLDFLDSLLSWAPGFPYYHVLQSFRMTVENKIANIIVAFRRLIFLGEILVRVRCLYF